MFTGIIEATGRVKAIVPDQKNLRFTIESPISGQLKIDQSVSHNGVCLTVVWQDETSHEVVAIDETLQRSNLSGWKVNDLVNLERSLRLDSLLDGHLVQGHVDQRAICKKIKEKQGSRVFVFAFEKKAKHILIDKGSVAVNGVSLTVIKPTSRQFSVAVIPYTDEHTNFATLKEGDLVNIEFDVMGKYAERILAAAKK